jgi:microcystin-dependent protein
MSAFVQTVVGSDSPPIGAVMDFAGNVEPSGWLFCFGQALPRTGIYAQLFGVIGTLYGAPDGSTFSLPDFRGRWVRVKIIWAGRLRIGCRLRGAWMV